MLFSEETPVIEGAFVSGFQIPVTQYSFFDMKADFC